MCSPATGLCTLHLVEIIRPTSSQVAIESMEMKSTLAILHGAEARFTMQSFSSDSLLLKPFYKFIGHLPLGPTGPASWHPRVS